MSITTSHRQTEDGWRHGAAGSRRAFGWRGVLSACGLLAIIIPLIAFGLSSAFSSLVGNTVEASLRRSAADTANSWAQYFGKNFIGFDQVLSTGTLDTAQREFVAAAQQIGQVYRFRLFNARGRLVVSSDQANEPADATTHNDHDVDAVRVIETGKGIVRLGSETGWPGEPVFTALALVPVLSDVGEPLGVVAIQVDLTSVRSAFLQSFNGLSLKLSTLAIVIFLIPACGFGWRSIQNKLLLRRLGLVVEAAEHGSAARSSERKRVDRLIAAPGNQAKDTSRQSQHSNRLGQDKFVFDNLIVAAVEAKAQSLPEWINFECHLGVDDLAVSLEQDHVRHVIEVLLDLSARSLGEAAGGKLGQGAKPARITVATSHSERGIEVSISDNRQGNDQESLTMLVDPAFKTIGVGSGLEFQAVQKSQKQHGGGLDVRFQPGRGAEYVAWWPTEFAKREAA